jgi:hypothetical protein
MSPWKLNQLAVFGVWMIGVIGPLINAQVEALTTWSIFAAGVAILLTLLEKMDSIVPAINGSESNVSGNGVANNAA